MLNARLDIKVSAPFLFCLYDGLCGNGNTMVGLLHALIARYVATCLLRLWRPYGWVKQQYFFRGWTCVGCGNAQFSLLSLSIRQVGPPLFIPVCHECCLDRSLPAVCRSILVLTPLANTRAGQSERRVPPAPIKAPEFILFKKMIIFLRKVYPC